MGDLFGISGSTHYLLNQEKMEAHAFDNFGESVGSIDYLSAYSSIIGCAIEVDIVSVLGTSLDNHCEIYLNGKVAQVDKNYLDMYSKIAGLSGKANHLVYRVLHPEKCSQLLVPFKKGFVSYKGLYSGDWCDA